MAVNLQCGLRSDSSIYGMVTINLIKSLGKIIILAIIVLYHVPNHTGKGRQGLTSIKNQWFRSYFHHIR